MKKLLLFILTITIVGLLYSCSETREYISGETTKYSDEYVADVYNEAPRIGPFTIESLMKESAIIVEIEIVENLGETENPSSKTFFQCNVITVIKGDAALKSIKIMQGVNSNYQFYGYPIFDVGQKYVLFLAKATGGDYTDDMYWIRGDYLSVIRIDTVNGTEYAYKLFGSFKDFPFENEENAFKSMHYERQRLFEELYKRLSDADST